jgi:hypothetical protein
LVEPPTLVKIAVAHRHHDGLSGRSHHRLNEILLFSPPRPHFDAYANKGARVYRFELDCDIRSCSRNQLHYTPTKGFAQQLI